MRKYSILTIFFITFSFIASGQSSIANERVASLCKVWGFLKYYDPTIASGKLNWDSVFVNNIQQTINCKTNTEFNKILLSIINDAGKTYETKRSKTPDSINTFKEVNIEWITKSTIFNSRIKNKLDYIYNHKNLDSNKYIKIVYNTADFSGENNYEDMGFPDIRYRLLFLSRFWNIINYFAPYKYLVGENWDHVLIEFIPRFLNVTDTVSYYKVWMELAKALHDGHSQLTLNNQDAIIHDLVFGKYTVPFYCQIIDGQVVVRKISDDSVCKRAGIKRGDVILKIDNEPIEKQIQLKRKFISASNKLSENHELSWYVLYGQTPIVHLTVKRGDRIFTTSIKKILNSENFQKNWRNIFNYSNGNSVCKKLDDSTLLIYTARISAENIDTVKSIMKQLKAVIFDVRNYPNNDALYSLIDLFLSQPKTINYSTVALPTLPGFFKWKLNPNKIGHTSDSALKGRVIILCDERTQSQGEYTCMALQTIPKSITIGTQTAGADGVVTYIPIGGDLNISYSGYGVYYPDKTQTQRVGVKIDIIVKKTIDGVSKNKDEILERALQYLKSGKE
jgi:carboxyl-terminal processing protease